MIWSVFASVIALLLDSMAGVFTTMDTIILVTMPSSYQFTLLDLSVVCFITGEMVYFIENL